MPDLFHIDDYDKCMLYGNETLYCTVKFQLYPENPDNSSRIWQIIQVTQSYEFLKNNKQCFPGDQYETE